jgi:hypothetical protein
MSMDDCCGPLQTPRSVEPQTYKIAEFVVGSFGLDSVLLTEGSIVEHYTRSGSDLANDYGRGRAIIERRGAPDSIPTGRVFPDVSKKRAAFMFMSKAVQVNSLTLRSFETSATTRQTTQCHIQEHKESSATPL